LKEFAHDKLLGLFRTYCLIGGMPEIIASYANKKDLTSLKPIYESLLVSYLDDVEKYAGNSSQIDHIRHAIRSAFAEAGKRIKFQHFGNSPYKSREMGDALRALEKALLIYLVYPQTSSTLPLLPDLEKSPRLHVLDTGMLNYFVGIQEEIIMTDELSAVYRGTLIEHIVGQELLARQFSALGGLKFWVREKPTSNAEIDYLIEHRGKLIPVEVKSGSSGAMRSLGIFMDMAPHEIAVRLYSGKLSLTTANTLEGKEFKLLNLPYYLAGKINDYLEWTETNRSIPLPPA